MKVKGRLSGITLARIGALSVSVLLVLAACIILGPFRLRPFGRISFSHAPVIQAPASPVSQNISQSTDRTQTARFQASFSKLPMVFERNSGQDDASADFVAHGSGYTLSLNRKGAVLGLRTGAGVESFHLNLAGAARDLSLAAFDPLPGKSNYLIGNDPSKWQRNVTQFARVKYQAVYPGIDLVFYGNQGHLEYDFQVAPGANPALAELEVDHFAKLAFSGGDLIVHAKSGDLRFQAPHIYQREGSVDRPVEGRFVLRAANRVGFKIGAYDRRRELIIDPVLTYSTYFGGNGSELCHSFVSGQTETPGCPAIAVDNIGDVFLVGATASSANFPVPISGPTQHGPNANIFVAKINPNAQSAAEGLEYLTFLGGSGIDASAGVAVDGGGNAYIAGTTTSADFPVTPVTAYQTAPQAGSAGTSHVFVTVLDSAGSSLKYSSYLSGNGTDIASGVTVDTRGNLYVTGTTTSTNPAGTTSIQFPASSPPEAEAFQTFSRAPIQFFVTKVNTAASGIGSIAYSTYFGGATPSTALAIGGGIAVDATSNVYFTGTTNFIFTGQSPTTDFPILNAYQPCLNQAPTTNVPPVCSNSITKTDAFIAKLNPAHPQGNQLIWSTYYGGTGDDSGVGIATDTGAANVYITGTTDSTNIPIPATIAPFQKCLDTPPNPNNPTSCPASSGATDAYVARVNNPSTGSVSLTYSSYFGGSGAETGNAITVDTASGAFITGSTDSTNLPTTANAIQTHNNGGTDAFLARLNTTTTVAGQTNVGAFGTYFGGTGNDVGTSLALDASLNTYLAGNTASASSFTVAGPALQTTIHGSDDDFVAKLGTSASLSICGYISTQKNCPPNSPAPLVSAGTQVTFTYLITNNGPDLATNITVVDSVPAGVTFNSATATSGTCSESAGAGTPAVCSIATLQSGSTATVTVVMTPGGAGAFNGGTVIVSSSNNSNSNDSVTVGGEATDFQVTVAPANQVVTAGVTAVYTVTITPLPVFTGNVSLSCSSGVPSQASCNFTTNPVPIPSTGPVTSTLNLVTTARPVTTQVSPLHRLTYAFWLVIPGLALVGIGAAPRTNRRQLLGVIFLCLLSAPLLLQPACSSSRQAPAAVGGTPPNTYTITLTATSGVVHNATFTLTVN